MKAKPEYDRNLEDYSTKYFDPFEEIQIKFRRKKVLEILNSYSPKIILEVGCGKDSVVNYLSNSTFNKFIIVELISSFLKVAVTNKSKKIVKLNYKIEDIPKFNHKIDIVIISSLLHEVADPLRVLKAICELVNENTIVHINITNAQSFHRILAKEMGIISSVFEISTRQVLMQQLLTINYESLTEQIELSGFEIIDKESYLLNPSPTFKCSKCLIKI